MKTREKIHIFIVTIIFMCGVFIITNVSIVFGDRNL